MTNPNALNPNTSNQSIKGEGGLFGADDATEQFTNANISMVYAIGAGAITGANDWAKSIYINDTVLENPDNSRNFKTVTFETRLGEPTQPALDDYDTQENLLNIDQTVTLSTPIVRTLTTANASSAKVSILAGPFYNQDDGALEEASATLKIELAASGGDFNTMREVEIKLLSTSGFVKTYEFGLTGDAPWRIRVSKLGGEHNTSKHKNTLKLSSITEIEKVTLNHNGVALLKLNFDASEIGSTPQVNVKVKLQQIPVPNNYNEATGTYNGIWDLGFKPAHTTNPVWFILYMLRSTQDGLGRVNDAIDWSAFYECAKYCDEFIDNGIGGLRKRFTFNGQINDAKPAFNMLQDIASIFHGRVVSDGQFVTISDDRPRDVSILVQPSNVVNGEFIRETLSRNNIISRVKVSWNDPEVLGKKVVEIVEDASLITKYGVKTHEIHRIACTNRQEALAHAKWELAHQKHAFTIRYKAALDHMIANGKGVLSGDVVAINDAEFSGRLLEVNDNNVKLDHVAKIEHGKTYELWITNVLGDIIKHPIIVPAGEYETLNITADAVIGATYQLICENNANLMRVVSISVNAGVCSVLTIPYEHNLTNQAEQPSNINNKTYEQLRGGKLPDLLGINFTEKLDFIDGIEAQSGGLLSAKVATNVRFSYIKFEMRTNGQTWQTIGNSPTGTIEVEGLKIGKVYDFRAKAVGRFAVASNWFEINGISVAGRPDLPPAPTLFNGAGGALTATLNWENPDITDFKEVIIYRSDNSNFANAFEQAHTRSNWLQINNLTGGNNYYFWARTLVYGNGVYKRSLLTSPVVVNVHKLMLHDIDNAVLAPLREDIDKGFADSIAHVAGINDANFKINQEKTINDTRFAKVGELETAFANEVSANATEFESLQTQYDAASSEIIKISDAQSGQITENIADIFNLLDQKGAFAQLQGKIKAVFGTQNAQIISMERVIVDGDKAIAQKIEILSVKAGENQAEFIEFKQVTASLTQGLEAEYILSLDINGQITGMKLRSDSSGTSEFIIHAHVFKIVTGNGAEQVFEVVGGNTYIKAAYIREITIDQLKGGTLGATMLLGDLGSIKAGGFELNKFGIYIG